MSAQSDTQKTAVPPASDRGLIEQARSSIHALRRRLKGPRLTIALVIALLLICSTLVVHYLTRGKADDNESAVIAVAKVSRENLSQKINLAGEFRPYEQVALHAKVAGFLQWISVDVGDHVKEGQTIAHLDVPELQNQLEKDSATIRASQEEVSRAQAGYADAHIAFQRLQEVAKDHPKLVAQQELDTAQAKDRESEGAVAAAKQHVAEAQAELDKTTALISYTNLVVPFDGVVTRRYADPGALIQTGTASNTQAMPVVDIAQDSRLRLVFPVPESAVPAVGVGAPIQVTIGSIGQTLTVPISRFADKIDRETGTMSTEADVANPDGHLTAGMYAEIKLLLRQSKNAVAVPVEAVSTGDTPSCFVVDRQNRVVLRPLQIGMQTPEKDEVLQGLKPGELVVVGSRSGIQVGQKVRPKLTETTDSP